MKQIFTLMVSAWVLLSLGAQAQVSDAFNSRTSITTSQVKGHLEGNCWMFNAFDVNQGWTPAIEGDGAMVSGNTATTTQKSGIYSPMVDIPGEVTISFKYKLSAALVSGQTRWIKFYLTGADGSIYGGSMGTLDFAGKAANTVYTFNQRFDLLGSGPYRVYLNLQGSGGDVRIAIDQLSISAPLYYPGGCNSAPVAVNDDFSGAANHSASGVVTMNDSDPNFESFDAYLTQNSTDGNVVLNTDGSFTFTPNPGFSGNFTTFKYQICDFGYVQQCSQEATVTITFAPTSTLPVKIVDFKGLYKDDGKVEISWVTTFEQNSDHFEVERSLNGVDWVVVGSVKAAGNSGVKKSYQFIDDVGRLSKKDLYYRLRQIDADSKASVTKILVVRVYNTRSLKMVSVSPNPAKNDIAVNVQLNEDSYIVMKVMTGNGVEVMRKSAKAGVGSNSYLMDGSSNLKPGLYLLEVTINSKERMIVKLIKE